jgi:energy-coupling factor transporter ATP-binding protein EcfA2
MDNNVAPSPYNVTVNNTIRISRTMQRNFRPNAFQTQTDSIISGIMSTARVARGWHAELTGINGQPYIMSKDTPEVGMLTATTEIKVQRGREAPTMREEFDQIILAVTRQGAAVVQVGGRWKIESINNIEFDEEADIVEKAEGEIGYAPIMRVSPLDWDSEFYRDLFGLDAQTRLLKDAIDAALDSQFQHRFNIVLVGPPGCGKTEMCKIIKKLYGDAAVMEFDGTSTTAAGAQKRFAELAELPRILIIEEIEKANAEALNYLLSMLDTRGEVRKVTAKGNIDRDTKVLAIVTVNNWAKFKRIASGALSSRFATPIKFGRPSPKVMRMILEREIKKLQDAGAYGNIAWIDHAMKFADEMGVKDPRRVIALCLNGKDRWFDGSFEADCRETMVFEAEEDDVFEMQTKRIQFAEDEEEVA